MVRMVSVRAISRLPSRLMSDPAGGRAFRLAAEELRDDAHLDDRGHHETEEPDEPQRLLEVLVVAAHHGGGEQEACPRRATR